MQVDDLLRELLAAPDDETRAAASARLAAVPDALTQIASRLSSPEWEQRELALHFITRLPEPPALFASGVIHCLRRPMGDPHSDASALVLVCCGLLASEVSGFRDEIASRVAAIDAAVGEGPRGPTMSRLAHETLAKIDASIAASKAARKHEIDSLAALVRAGRRDDAETAIDAMSADSYYPELGRAALWEGVGEALASSDRDAARFCLERAHHNFQWHASGASSGGEGMARMIDVNRLAERLRRL